MIKKILFCFIVLFLFFVPIANSQSPDSDAIREEMLEGEVVSVLEEKIIIEGDNERLYQELEILVTEGSLENEKIIVENGIVNQLTTQEYETGDELIITKIDNINGETDYFITDFVRRDQIYYLFGIFFAAVVAVGGLRGAYALSGMVFTFSVIFFFILPRIAEGADPVFISILSAVFIIPVTFALSHGISRKTASAMLGTILGLLITGILANIFVDAASLTGFSSDEAGFLKNINSSSINIRGLLLAGIILGALGVLDDITISQASVVEAIKKTSKSLSTLQLFKKAMEVGRDHIASMVNTLFLVYTGASLPLLLLFTNSNLSFSAAINYEIIAEEIIRTLIASIGLIAAVPITTIIASLLLAKEKQKS